MTWHSVVLASAPQRQLLKMSAHSENRYYYKKGSSKKQPEDRLFDKKQKEQCWAQSPKVPGRDPERWRIDAAGNIVLRKLTGCMGCLCYDYDHIVPYSKGGKTEVPNCQILQTRVNRSKSDAVKVADNSLRLWSCASPHTAAEMDLIEMAVYGNVQREGLQCFAKTISEMESSGRRFKRPDGAPPGCFQ